MGRRKYTPETREAAAQWLIEHDEQLYGEGVSMSAAAKRFSDEQTGSVTAHFLGRVAAKLRRSKQLSFRPKLRPIAEPVEGLLSAEWEQLTAAVRLAMMNDGCEAPSGYIARRLRSGRCGACIPWATPGTVGAVRKQAENQVKLMAGAAAG